MNNMIYINDIEGKSTITQRNITFSKDECELALKGELTEDNAGELFSALYMGLFVKKFLKDDWCYYAFDEEFGKFTVKINDSIKEIDPYVEKIQCKIKGKFLTEDVEDLLLDLPGYLIIPKQKLKTKKYTKFIEEILDVVIKERVEAQELAKELEVTLVKKKNNIKI